MTMRTPWRPGGDDLTGDSLAHSPVLARFGREEGPRQGIFPQALARPCYKTKPKKLFLLSLENACSSYGSCSIGSKLKRNRASLCVVVQLKVPAVTT